MSDQMAKAFLETRMQTQNDSLLSDGETAAAQRFADCCYDEKLRMPSRNMMLRLVKKGIVVELGNGFYEETPKLRELGF